MIVGATRVFKYSPPEYMFWALECIALTAMVFFTPVHVYLGPTNKPMLGLSDRREREFKLIFQRLAADVDSRASSITGEDLRNFFEDKGLSADDVTSLHERVGTMPDKEESVPFHEFVEIYVATLLEHGQLTRRAHTPMF